MPREQDRAKIIAARKAKAAAAAARARAAEVARRRASAGSEGPRFLARSQPPAVPQLQPPPTQQIFQSPDVAIQSGQITPPVVPFQTPLVAFTGAGMEQAPPPIAAQQAGELSTSRVSGAGLVIDPFGFSTTPQRAQEALSGAVAGFTPQSIEPPQAPAQVARPIGPGTDVFNEEIRRGIEESGIMIINALGEGQIPTQTTTGVLDYIANRTLFGPNSDQTWDGTIEELADALGLVEERPGVWRKLEQVTNTGYGGGAYAGGGVGGRGGFGAGFRPGRGSSVGGFGLVMWRI